MATPVEQGQRYLPAGSTVTPTRTFASATKAGAPARPGSLASIVPKPTTATSGYTPIVNPYTGFVTGVRPLTSTEVAAKATPIRVTNTPIRTVSRTATIAKAPTSGPAAVPAPRTNANGGQVTTPILPPPASGTVSSLGGILSQLAADATRFAEPLLLIALLILVYSYLRRHRGKKA